MLTEVLAASGDPATSGLNWTAILIGSIPGLLALIAVVIGKIVDLWRGKHEDETTRESRREPSWHELVGENRALRSDLVSLEGRFDEYKEATDLAGQSLKGKVESMEIERKMADRRELLLYRHTKALRDHIINELPPPPPTAPQELIDWFAQFEQTDPGRLNLHSE